MSSSPRRIVEDNDDGPFSSPGHHMDDPAPSLPPLRLTGLLDVGNPWSIATLQHPPSRDSTSWSYREPMPAGQHSAPSYDQGGGTRTLSIAETTQATQGQPGTSTSEMDQERTPLVKIPNEIDPFRPRQAASRHSVLKPLTRGLHNDLYDGKVYCTECYEKTESIIHSPAFGQYLRDCLPSISATRNDKLEALTKVLSDMEYWGNHVWHRSSLSKLTPGDRLLTNCPSCIRTVVLIAEPAVPGPEDVGFVARAHHARCAYRYRYNEEGIMGIPGHLANTLPDGSH